MFSVANRKNEYLIDSGKGMISKIRLIFLLCAVLMVVFLKVYIFPLLQKRSELHIFNNLHVHAQNNLHINSRNRNLKESDIVKNDLILAEERRLLFGLDRNIENVPKKNYVGEINEQKEHVQDNFQDKSRLGNILLEKKDLDGIREQEITEKKETNQEKNQKNKSTDKESEIVSLEKGEPVSKAKELSASIKIKLQETVGKTSAAATPDSSKNLPSCSRRGVKLVGPLFVDQTIPKNISVLNREYSVESGGAVEKGGWYTPPNCTPRVKVAVIIPYRNRFEQLKIFLRHLHPFLQRQQLMYRIIVVEQLSDDPFNRAGLFNVGFKEALKLNDFECFIFTDVDLLPENDHNYYGCPTSPRHMSVAVDKFNYKLPYDTIFGGCGAFKKKDFEAINGMSNLFWGWGGEDDDLYTRITEMNFKLTRPGLQIGRYTMIKIHHFQSSNPDPNRMNLLQTSKERMEFDGLNTLKYELKKIKEAPLVTFVKVVMRKDMYNL